MLTKKQIAQYWLEGYIRLSHFFHPADIAPVTSEFYRIFLTQLRRLDILPNDIEHRPTWLELINSIKCLQRNNPTVYNNCCVQITRAIALYQLALDTRLLNIIIQLGQSHPTLHMLPQLMENIASTHKCDQLWKLWRPSVNSVGAYIHIGESPHDTSSLLHMIPGSHTGGLRSMRDIKQLPHEAYEPIYGNMDQYGTDLILFNPLIVSSVPESPYGLNVVTWCYSDLDDSTYIDHRYLPVIDPQISSSIIQHINNNDGHNNNCNNNYNDNMAKT